MSKKFIILSSVFAFILLISIWAYSVSVSITKDLNQTIENTVKNEENVDINGLVLTETQDGKKFWELYAKQAQYTNNDSVANMKDVVGNIYKDGKVVLSFKAPEALYKNKDKFIKLSGGAYAASDKNVTIYADELEWSNKKDLFYANGNVKIKQENKFYSTGNSSVFNKDFTNFKIKGNSKTRVYE